MSMIRVLASSIEEAQSQTFYWSAVIMGVAVVGFVIIMIIKRIMKSRQPETHEAGFSLSDLRAMRDRGEITPEEYEQTRTNVIAKVKQRADKPKPRPKADTGDENPTDLAG